MLIIQRQYTELLDDEGVDNVFTMSFTAKLINIQLSVLGMCKQTAPLLHGEHICLSPC